MGRKHGDLWVQFASLEEEVAQVRSRAREEKILLEASIEEVEDLKIVIVCNTYILCMNSTMLSQHTD